MPRRELHRPVDQRDAGDDWHIREVTVEISKVGRNKEIEFRTVSKRSNGPQLWNGRPGWRGAGPVALLE